MASDPAVARRAMDGLLRRGRATSFDPRWFEHAGHRLTADEIVAILAPHVTDARRERIETVLDHRTYNLAVVVDGMVDSGNVSAVMRSADAFGIQPFHAVDRAASYKHSRRTAQGARKWVDRWVWRRPDQAIGALRDEGYRIVIADLDAAARSVAEIDFASRCAIVFGNELAGVSDEFRAAADEVAMIPMSGFTQSLNISVAAAVFMYEARRVRARKLGRHGDLSADDRARLRAVFTMKSVKHAAEIIERFLDQPDARTRLRGLDAPSDRVT